MRVISGSARRLPLKTPEGMDTRPTQDRIKETLFNMLQSDIPGCRFLDLFAGSGAIGIEALSRGASEAVFMENNPKAAAVIRDNLHSTRLEENARVLQGDLFSLLPAEACRSEVYDIIFMDPPYRHDYEKKVLELLQDSSLADSYTLIIVEASLDTPFDYLEDLGYDLVREKKYKTNKHVFIRKRS
ncbi:MAG: 16S rRNA (guanine(966)-N(2))-methyltransferase RsmD [Lachnospiraceae bacterium]|nr:16S rRNA (guanine(966)-N(2))-methyltransferase RsmD [Lachnospiraceae bacterium]